MHADLDKCHKVSLRLSRKLHHHFWQEIRNIKVMKCPPYSSNQEDRTNNLNSNLKVNLKTKLLTLKLQQGGLRLD